MMERLNRYEHREEGGAYLTPATIVETERELLKQIVTEAAAGQADNPSYPSVQFTMEMDESIRRKIRQHFGDVFVDNEDGYAIDVADNIRIFASSLRGLLYGAYSLQQLAVQGYIQRGLIYNVPLCSFRGLKVYLPAQEDLAFFKEFIDMACYYRYNTVVFEVGGAMEYKRHPEINEGWVDYCREMRRYSGRSKEIQRSCDWPKNSIHSENGGGSWLPQDMVRELVDYCRQRGMDVIPEVPSLSHCDYLLTRHPELAERPDDPYPDTYCPSNPASYELLFDVLDEVIDVFRPAVVHVGHDEYYSIGVCDACRGKDAADIFADDLNRIEAYLSGKGIGTMIWCEKLINSASKLGNPVGGAEREVYRDGKHTMTIPGTYPAIDRISNSVQMMHWYWSVRQEYDDLFLDRNMTLIFGNFAGFGVPDWSRRLSRGVSGVCISNWSALREDYMQRNAVFFNMAYSSCLLWKEGYDESMYASLAEETFAELFRYKNRRTLSTAHLEVVHSTSFTRDYAPFVDGTFIVEEEDRLGRYVLEFDDQSASDWPLVYGLNITGNERSWELQFSEKYDVYNGDSSLWEVSCTALPIRDGDRTFYRIVIPLPADGRKLTALRFIPEPGKSDTVMIREVRVRH